MSEVYIFEEVKKLAPGYGIRSDAFDADFIRVTKKSVRLGRATIQKFGMNKDNRTFRVEIDRRYNAIRLTPSTDREKDYVFSYDVADNMIATSMIKSKSLLEKLVPGDYVVAAGSENIYKLVM